MLSNELLFSLVICDLFSALRELLGAAMSAPYTMTWDRVWASVKLC